MSFLVFKLSDHYFGIDINSIVTILPPAQLIDVPSKSQYLLGILETKDYMIPVFQPHLLFNMEPSPLSESHRYIVMEYNPYYALQVDEVHEVLNLETTLNIASFQYKKKFIHALAELDDNPVYIMDFKKLHQFFGPRLKMSSMV